MMSIVRPWTKSLTVLSLCVWGCTDGAVVRSTLGAAAQLDSVSARAPSATADRVAVDAIGCVLGDDSVPRDRCATLAALAGASQDMLVRAEHDVIDRLSEYVGRRARAERMPPARRVGVLRWFDLGIAAAREAALANASARAAHLATVRADPMRGSDLDAVERAVRLDVAAVRARAHLDALRAFAREGMDGAVEADALSVWIATARVEGARHADDMLREDAQQTASELAIDVAGSRSAGVEPRATTTPREVRELRGAMRPTVDGVSLDVARARLQARAEELCGRCSDAVRARCERIGR
jgi:hypothetical protein